VDIRTPDRFVSSSRRRFLDGLLGGSLAALGASILYPVLRYLSPPRIPEAATTRVLAAKVAEIEAEGWRVVPFGSEPAIVIKIAPGTYRAFSGTCTHLSCTVQFDEASKRIWCACHNGWYDLEGRNLAGPPPRPLTSYSVQVVGDDVFVSRG
jgi:Rieske Fe-S protein